MTARRDDDIGAAIRAAARSVRAPAHLQASVAEERERRGGRRGPLLAVVAGIPVAVLVAVVVVTGSEPSVEQLAVTALRPPTRPAPPPDAREAGSSPPRSACGSRTTSGSGDGRRTACGGTGRRRARAHRRLPQGLAAFITRSSPAIPSAACRRVDVDGTRVAVVPDADASVVAWHRGRRTCVLASRTVSTDQLLRMVAWG